MPSIAISGHRIEYQQTARTRAGTAPLVFLHEGLGSLAMWKDFPAELAAASGAPALVYSRYGYGNSDPIAAPRRVDYMHEEALEALPALLGALHIANPILIGHSDGASIALIHAGAGRWPVRGLILEAPHVFVEDATISSIDAAREVYRATDLNDRLRRYHADPDNAFWGWNDIWLDPAFRAWNIEASLPSITCPVLAIQGADDEYGTLAQLDAIERGVRGPFERLVLAQCKHSPHRDQPAATLAAMARFIAGV
ncbi:MAG TPA: alpha/beta hydrolase [Stellaceae bacterium]|nr:alpha/beta hydrolase [Stellaceae bacterium]